MNKSKILVVEDEAVIALDIELQLMKLGYEPIGHATCGEQAIVLAGELRPDLVLMDIQLGSEMDGIAAAAAIRDQFALPVVFLTAFATDETLVRAKLAEPFGYILKPFSERDLRIVIEIALYKHDACQKLRESEELYRTLCAELQVGVLIQSASGEIVLSNLKALELLGLTEDQLLGKTFLDPDWDFIHEDGTPFSNPIHPLPLASANCRAVRDVVVGLQRPNRRERAWLLVNADSQLNLDGSVRQVLCTFTDITERKNAIEKLRVSDAALEAVSQGVIITGSDRLIYSVNDAFTTISGYSKAEVLGRNCRFVQGPLTDRKTIKQLSQALSDATEFCGEILNYRKDGSTFWNELTISPVRDEQGHLTHFVGVTRDITERKRAQAAIDEAAQRLQIALDGSQISIWEFDLQTREVWLDAAWETFLDQPAAETHTTAFELLKLVHPQDRRSVICAATQTMRGIVPSYAIDHRVKTTTGEWRWVHSRGRVVERDSNGIPLRMSGTNTNITRHKQAEAARASLESQLSESQRLEAIASLEAQLRESQKMEAVGTLAGGIAHDFNNILATILGNTELARLDASTNPLALESLEEIHKAATRARDLVQQILSFSRRQPTSRQRIGLAPLLEESARLLRSTLPARITVEVECSPCLPPVMADATQVQQVLINLATNAMQAIGDKPGRIGFQLDTVMLDASLAAAQPVLYALFTKRPGLTLRLRVSDDGFGMDAVTLSRIFEPFFTTKAVDEGTGLGLSVVHGIVQAHDGAIAVESQPGEGAIFTLYLPAAEAEQALPEFKAEILPSCLSSGSNPIYQILYLDDDPSLVFLVKRLLERRGCKVSAHTNQRDALETLRAEPNSFDLVVTDYNMPGMSGLDVAREVRSIRADLPVAVASGFIDEVLSANAAEAGVRELIFKASTVEDFCATVRRLAETVVEISSPKKS